MNRVKTEGANPAPTIPSKGSMVMTRRRVWLARGLAALADLVQWVLLPFFLGGGVEGPAAALDAVMAVLMIWLCGWHIAFLPTAVAEALPMVDLFPTWTAAAFFVTRPRGQDREKHHNDTGDLKNI